MENIGSTIDWERCRRNIIVAGSPLPDNIRAIQTPALDASSLDRALKLLGGLVTAVNIETTNSCPELIGFPHHYIESAGRFNFETPLSTSFNDTNFLLRQEFGRRIHETKDKIHKALLDVWQTAISAMISAAAHRWPRSYNMLQVNGMGRFDQCNTHGFHRHGGLRDPLDNTRILPGVFLNHTPSYDGTMFPGSDKNLWYAPGGSNCLFTTDDHPHMDGCDHSPPNQFKSPISGEKRATAVLMVYPIPEV